MALAHLRCFHRCWRIHGSTVFTEYVGCQMHPYVGRDTHLASSFSIVPPLTKSTAWCCFLAAKAVTPLVRRRLVSLPWLGGSGPLFRVGSESFWFGGPGLGVGSDCGGAGGLGAIEQFRDTQDVILVVVVVWKAECGINFQLRSIFTLSLHSLCPHH